MKEIGTEWWFEPRPAGYGDMGRVWDPDIVRIVGYPESRPLPAGTPARQYIVRFDAGHQLFANDDCLFAINALRTGPLDPIAYPKSPELLEEERLQREDSLRRARREELMGRIITVG